MPGLSKPPVWHHPCFRAGIFVIYLFFFLGIVSPSAAGPAGPIINTEPDTGNITVFDPTTHTLIPQFAATDGGSGKLVNILWILFGLVVGGPMGVFGLRGGRLSTGAACGLVGTVSIWAAFVNSLSMPLAGSPNTADLVLTLSLLASFIFLTFLGSFLRTLHPLGLGLIGAAGGTSLFMRIVILKSNLLIPIYALNLALLGAGAVLGGVLVIWKRRLSVLFFTSLLSTFLVALAVDLILNINAPPQQGMSRGLKLLMDRNPAHLADIEGTHYEPTLRTQVIIGASLVLVPILGYTQHRLFPGPFTYNLRRTLADSERDSTFLEGGTGPDFSAGRPLDMASRKGTPPVAAAHMAISGPIFGAVGHGSRFST